MLKSQGQFQALTKILWKSFMETWKTIYASYGEKKVFILNIFIIENSTFATSNMHSGEPRTNKML